MRSAVAVIVALAIVALFSATFSRSAFAASATSFSPGTLALRPAAGLQPVELPRPVAAQRYAQYAPVRDTTETGSLWNPLAVGVVAFLGGAAAAVVRGEPTASRIATRHSRISMQLAKTGKKLLVIGGNGFVGQEVCKYAVQNGFEVTSLSRRGQCPDPADELLSQVDWQAGNALDQATINKYVDGADAVVHAIGLLFDVDSGLKQLNFFTSASKSSPDAESTYDNITRKTAFMVIDALNRRLRLPGSKRTPLAFVSCAESGWTDVKFGDAVEKASPDWLKRYLVAKRAVEGKLASSSSNVRSVIVRPSLIWNWKKLDVLPIIPIFNIANALGVPFVDKTVRVETVGAAIVAGLLNEQVEGVQRFDKMEQLAETLN